MEAAGYCAGLYSCRSRLELLRSAFPDRMAGYDVWNAQWSDRDSYSGAHGMWQYSASGTVGGINGPVGMDAAYLDYPALIRSAGKNGFARPDAGPGGAEAAPGVDGELRRVTASRSRLADRLRRIKEITDEREP